MKIRTDHQMIRFLLIIQLITFSLHLTAQEEYCCQRILMFPSFPMPEGQEHDLSRAISFIWLSLINKTGAHELAECPNPLELRSWEGNLNADSLTSNMSAATQKIKPTYTSDEEARKGADYIWKGKLELLAIDKITPGKWDDAYIDEHTKPGTKHYEPGYATGKWRFTIQLYNPFWDEVIKEASTPEWDGDGDLDEPYQNLYNQNFSNLKEILLDYEKAPKKAQFESEVIKVNSDKTKRITFKVTDAKGEKPKKWQRLAVKVDYGSLTNGTRCCEIGEGPKFYSFMCEEGEVTIEYKAPTEEKYTLDHITVYNGCIIKDPGEIPMTNVDIREEIGSVDVDINPVYETRLVVKGRYIRNSSSRYHKEDANGVERGNSDLKELQEATFYVPLELERSDDMPMFNQRWEYYRPFSIRLSSCIIFSRLKQYDYESSGRNGFEKTTTRYREPLYTKISGKETIIPLSNIVLVIDKETDKVVKIVTGGYAVEFFWHERYQVTGRQWSDNNTSPISRSDNKTDDLTSQYNAGPVEDEIPDPTIKSVSQSLRTYLNNLGTPLPTDIEIPEEEERPEISPDLLVEFGDGRTFFGGDGKVVLEDETKPNSRTYSEKTFYWQVTRKKK